MRKVLILHGYSQNAAMFYKRMSVIRKACEKHVEFVFLDAPHVLVPADLASHSLEWLQAAEANSPQANGSLTPKAWWKSNAERTICLGIDESLSLMRDTLRETRFDGVLGFSQGAAMAAVLAAVLERPESYPSFMAGGEPIHPRLNFFISISGFLPNDQVLQTILSRTTPKLTTPSLHIIGYNDVIVTPERSQVLIDACEETSARIERHEGGHFVPSKANWRNFFKEYLINPSSHFIASPSALAAAAPSL